MHILMMNSAFNSHCKAGVEHGSVKGMTTDLRYPIGKYEQPASFSSVERTAAMEALAELPQKMHAAVCGLSETQIDTAYREGGWTVRQTVHHVADGHMRACVQLRMALTEDWPAIAPIKQSLWAELDDARTQPVEPSLEILNALHLRWVALLRSLPEINWTERGYTHPVKGRQTVEQIAALYAWHGQHHTAQITTLRERQGW